MKQYLSSSDTYMHINAWALLEACVNKDQLTDAAFEERNSSLGYLDGKETYFLLYFLSRHLNLSLLCARFNCLSTYI